MAIQLAPGEYRSRQYGAGRNSSGPSGRRKMRGFTIMRQEAAKAMKGHTVVLFCNDQHRNQGTGVIGTAIRDLGKNARAEAARLVAVAMTTSPLYSHE